MAKTKKELATGEAPPKARKAPQRNATLVAYKREARIRFDIGDIKRRFRELNEAYSDATAKLAERETALRSELEAVRAEIEQGATIELPL